MGRRVLSMLVTTAALVWPASAAAQEQIATDTSNGPIAAWSGVVAWSAWDDSAGAYRLVVDRGGSRSVLPVAASRAPFDVQAGPGPDGTPWLVWSRCDDGRPAIASATDCDIAAYDLAAGREQAVAAAADPERREFSPAIWRNRVAFARAPLGPETQRTLTRLAIARLAGARARAVPGMPVGICDYPEACGPARPTRVVSLALREDALAVSATYGIDGALPGICGLQEVRLADLRTGNVRRVSPTSTCGLSGQQYAAVRFDSSGDLWYVRSCFGDPAGCQGGNGDPFRYSPRSGRTVRLEASLGAVLTSLALDGEQPIVQASRGDGGCQSDPRCGTVRRVTGTLVSAPARRDRAERGGYRLDRRARPVVLARPPRRLACFDADPAPRRRAVLWVGAGTISKTGRAIPTPTLRVRVSAPGRRALQARLPGSANGRWRWRKLRLGAGTAGCGRSWTLSYTARGRRLARFRIAFAAS